LFTPPLTIKTGRDVVGPATARAFNEAGLSCVHEDLWPDAPARLITWRGGKLASLFYKYVVAPLYLRQRLQQVAAGDVVWINSVSWFNKLADTRFEAALKRRGARYILHLQDDWFSVPNYDAAARLRLPLADLVVVVTPALHERTVFFAPSAPVVTLEEPIDVMRLQPGKGPPLADGLPRIVWTGNIANLKELPGAHAILSSVYARHKFVLRIISGSRKPVVNLPIPWEWFPYSEADESALLGGACAGLAPLTDTIYARCKDMYKIKTYLAAGVPVIASPVGHNVDVLRHGATGFLASSQEEWIAALTNLLAQPEQARVMGLQARAEAEQRFSHRVLIPQWVEVLRRYFPDLAAN
jgi:glycosyltransferase involved in cell wall biosynthesis